jgi:hypothetical protein
MVLSREGTFAYVFDVPDRWDGRMQGTVCESIKAGARRLVGHTPFFQATEYQREPWQLYARITLTAADKGEALVSRVSFSVERGLVRVLRPGDLLHVSRTTCGGIGLSIVRDDRLIAAAGAITDVPLGADVCASYPADLIDQAEAILRTRDPKYRLRDRPIELSIAGETRILHSGRPRMGAYDVLVRHGFLEGLPGVDVCASIERRGVCPDTAAHTSAELLESEGLQLIER